MKLRKKAIWRLAGTTVVVLLLAGIAAPFISADRFGRRIQASLEQAIHRRVEIGKVRLDLFTGPGFSLSDVIIYDDPRMGAEPLAYVTSLEAPISLRSLWTGRLDFSSLRLVEPSVNLVKSPKGPWNFEALLSHTFGAAPEARAFPAIRVRGGRVNFKFGDVKSVFYLTDADIDISPPASGEAEWRLRFSGQPARTDHAVRGFGRFAGRGQWRPGRRTDDHLEITLELERSPLGEVIALLHGHDIGLHGRLSTHARLAGPISDLQITGDAHIEDIHRSDLAPPRGAGWPFQYRGRLDLVTQRLQLETAEPDSGGLPVTLRFRASDYLSEPRWGFTVTLKRLPLNFFPHLARDLGLALPEPVILEGTATGVVGFSPASGLQGMLACQDVSLRAPNSLPVRFTRAQFVIDRDRARLMPSLLETQEKEHATLEGEYAAGAQQLDLKLTSKSMSITGPAPGSGRLPGSESIPLLEHCRGGRWRGEVRYRCQAERRPEWTGDFEIRDSEIQVPGMADALELSSAHAALKDGAALLEKMRARMGRVEFEAQYRYQPKATRPHQFRVSVPELDAAELERLLAPTLSRRQGLLARALRFGRAPVPAWLAERRADGVLEIGSLSLPDMQLASRIRARLFWDGPGIELTNLEANAQGARLTGRLAVNLGRASPAYRLTAQVRSMTWMGGTWEGEGLAQTGGLGPDLLPNLRLAGSFKGRSVALAPEAEFQSIGGLFILTLPRGVPRLQVTEIEAASGQEVYRGEGRTDDDGRLSLEFTNGKKRLRLAGTLSPFQLEPVAVR